MHVVVIKTAAQLRSHAVESPVVKENHQFNDPLQQQNVANEAVFKGPS